MGLFSKRIEKQIESYQHELIETHYREVDNMYRQIRGWRPPQKIGKLSRTILTCWTKI